ncbi:hypothetical protein VTP01DRAFT_3521 [Rhizomucor pusillus]|uniref:uncharacterized protein n=1 Tax=Rhizomucor pusillus TaxID=4840 RepID=UPI00374302A2
MIAQFLYEDGQGNAVDENGRPEPMNYIVDQEQFALETISSHTDYLQKKPAEKSRANAMQVDKPRDEDSHMREVTEKRYTSYTPQDKARFFKLKIEKCMSASAAAKQLGIHAGTAQRWVKQYEERPDSIFESGKKKRRRRILTEEHVKVVIDFIDGNPSAVVAEVTEHLMHQFDSLKVTHSTVYNFMRTECNLSVKQAEFQSVERNCPEKIQERHDWVRNFLKDTSDEMNKYPQMKGHYLVMDNALIHKSEDIAKYITSRGYRYAYLPSYSPELNPIKQFWSVAKSKHNIEQFPRFCFSFT